MFMIVYTVLALFLVVVSQINNFNIFFLLTFISGFIFLVVLGDYSCFIYLSYFFTLDSLSLVLCYITVLVLVVSYSVHPFTQSIISVYLSFTGLLVSSFFVFSTASLFLLYVAYESSLVPISFIILNWGSYPDNGLSSLIIVLFTSVLTFPVTLLIVTLFWGDYTFIYSLLAYSSSPLPLSLLVWLLFAFAVKLPVYGLHYWLPIAHVEAPTFGSIILAGLLLKIGGCGLVRFLSVYSFSHSLLLSFLFSYILVSVIIVGVLCCTQSDMKRLVAYSSVLHMSILFILFLCINSIALTTISILIVFHGLSSPLLFHLVGIVYLVNNTRLLLLIRGFLVASPLVSIMVVFSFLVNIAVPPLPAFIAEVTCFISALSLSGWVIPVLLSTLFLVILYSLSWFIALLFNNSCAQSSLVIVSLYSLLVQFIFVFLSFSFIFTSFLF